MFNRMKERAKITDQDPTFKARYIGSLETYLGSGKGCTTALVQRLWDNAPDEQFLRKVKIRVTTSGLNLKFQDKKAAGQGQLFAIENISFCNVDTPVNDRIFSWIYRDSNQSQFECHAVFCSSTEKAKSMALVLSRAFQIAYKEWKARQSKFLRERGQPQKRSASMYASTEIRRHELVTRHQSDGLLNGMKSPTGEHNGVTGRSGKLTAGRLSVNEAMLADNSKRTNGIISEDDDDDDTKIEHL